MAFRLDAVSYHYAPFTRLDIGVFLFTLMVVGGKNHRSDCSHGTLTIEQNIYDVNQSDHSTFLSFQLRA